LIPGRLRESVFNEVPNAHTLHPEGLKFFWMNR